MGLLGPSISWLLLLIGETEGPVPIKTGVVALGEILIVFLSRKIVPPMFFQFTTGGSLKTRPVLRSAPVTIYLWITTRTAFKVLPLVVTPYMVVWLTGGMTDGMIDGTSRLVNNLCGEFPLVVSVIVVFLCFCH